MEVTINTMVTARKSGITIVPYVHDFLRDFNPSTVISKMFDLVGLPFSDSVIKWESDEGDPYFEGKIIKYDIPPDDWVRGALSTTKGGRGGLMWKSVNQEYLLSSEIKDLLVAKCPDTFEAYKEIAAHTKELLKL